MKKEMISQVTRKKPRPEVTSSSSAMSFNTQMIAELGRDVMIAWIERLHLGKSRIELH